MKESKKFIDKFFSNEKWENKRPYQSNLNKELSDENSLYNRLINRILQFRKQVPQNIDLLVKITYQLNYIYHPEQIADFWINFSKPEIKNKFHGLDLNIIRKKDKKLKLEVIKDDEFKKIKEHVDFYVHEKKRKEDIKNNIVPGVVLNYDERFKSLVENNIIDDQWFVILCATQMEDGKWMPCKDALLHWGSPIWCLKKDDHWNNYLHKNKNDENRISNDLSYNDNIQYVFIRKEFWPYVYQAATNYYSDLQEKHWVVPKNYGDDHNMADNYEKNNDLGIRDAMKRIGVTTHPMKEDHFFNYSNDKKITAHGDNNNQLSNLVDFYDCTAGLSLPKIDMEVRKIMNLKRSEFNTTLPSFKEIIEHIGYEIIKVKEEYNNKEDLSEEDQYHYMDKITEVSIMMMKKARDVINKITSMGDEYYRKFSSQINEYFDNNLDKLPDFHFFCIFADELSDNIKERLNRELEYERNNPDEEAYDSFSFAVRVKSPHLFLELFENKNIENNKFNQFYYEWHKKYVRQVFDLYLLDSKNELKDNDEIPSDIQRDQGCDVKTQLIYAYQGKRDFNNIKNIENSITKRNMISIFTFFVYKYDYEYGRKIIEQEGWEELLHSELEENEFFSEF